MKKRTKIIIGRLIVFIVTFFIYAYFENNLIEFNHITISDENIPKSFDGFKIMHFSDLHNKQFGKKQSKIINIIIKQKPDIIVITGDMIDARRANISVTLELITRAVKYAPVYYVNGNHEFDSGIYDKLKKELIDAGVVVLENQSVRLYEDEEFVNLIGINDPLFIGKKQKSTEVIDNYLRNMKIDASSYNILLSHRPEAFNEYINNSIDLAFTGHAHGGQIRLPFIGGIVAPNQGFFPKYTSGLYYEKETYMVVSRGLGNSIFPFRINNNPEIIMVTLKGVQ